MRWIGLFLLAAACGDNIAPISVDSYAARRIEAECTREVRCGLFSALDECEAYTFLIADNSLLRAVADGRVHYSEFHAWECVDALARRTCDGGTREARIDPDVCNAVFTGTLATSATCAFDTECASGRCMESGCDPSTCCAGMCVAAAPSAIGGTCALDRDCVANAYCGLDHTCHALGKIGDSCYRDSQCDDGLGCVTKTNPGVCRPLAATDAACPDGKCALIGDHCGSAMTCVPLGLPGSACAQSSDCSPTEVCDSGSCAALPEAGMPCMLRCTGDAWCDLTASICRPRLENAAPCDTDSQCLTGYCAEGVAYDYCADRPVCD